MSDNWETPQWIKKIFANFYDPCPLNADFDGLKSDWRMPAFVNPPYSNPLLWVQKAVEQLNKWGGEVVMLLRVDPSTKWYRMLVENNAHFFYINERLHFSDQDCANFASMLVVLEKSAEVGKN